MALEPCVQISGRVPKRRVRPWERLRRGGRGTGWVGETDPQGSASSAQLSLGLFQVFTSILCSRCGFPGLKSLWVQKARLLSVDVPKQLSDSQQPSPEPHLLPALLSILEVTAKGGRPQPSQGHLGTGEQGSLELGPLSEPS